MTTAPSQLVLVDSSVWIDFLSRPNSQHRSTLNELIQRRIVATTGIVIAEVLYGARLKDQFDTLADWLFQAYFLETTQAVWETVAALAFDLKTKGESLPLPDLILAAVSLQHGCQLLTRDKAFQRIPALRLYTPEAQ